MPPAYLCQLCGHSLTMHLRATSRCQVLDCECTGLLKTEEPAAPAPATASDAREAWLGRVEESVRNREPTSCMDFLRGAWDAAETIRRKETMSNAEEPVFWDCADGEELHHTDPDDAIECYLNNRFPQVPERITLTGYARDEVPQDAIDHLLGEEGGPLRAVLDALQEPYGNPEEPIDATSAMLEAEKAFVAVILKEFKPWACHEVCSEEINVKDWLRENDPDRLADIERARGLAAS